jgi:hypothetical protein
MGCIVRSCIKYTKGEGRKEGRKGRRERESREWHSRQTIWHVQRSCGSLPGAERSKITLKCHSDSNSKLLE